MATGSMAIKSSGKMMLHFTLALLTAGLFPVLAAAQEVGLAGIMGSKAMLMVNGGEPQAVAIGQSLDGVKLLSVQGDQVVVEVGGKKRPLRVGQHAIGVSNGDGSGKIIMTADGQGHFYTTGTINGTSVRFVVDTGATMISLGATDAKRIGLDFNRGEKMISHTANGQTVVSKLQLDTVRLGDITLHGVDAVIHQNEMPIALLGMSFLNRMEMQRDGSTMTLKKRF
ncbi:retropepsin-like aspartic protease family protein [Quatrionicoccus australiensis]|uniref:retropepsin-like aspartic protease family protein n=1 Tax=Quatrionicoccus australiensis TaxID=138118 RepID=UPI001CF8F855|nr:TIGR02281 family clan AA aspartic protease [Quatrionicoccus australiensis]